LPGNCGIFFITINQNFNNKGRECLKPVCPAGIIEWTMIVVDKIGLVRKKPFVAI